MLNFEPGLDVVLNVQFRLSGEPFIPIAGSVVYTLRDQTSGEVPGHIRAPLTTGPVDTSTLITIPAALNTITAPRRFEKRVVTVWGSAAGNLKPWSVILPYRLVPSLPHVESVDTLRAYLGIDQSELLDAEIDIFAAYLQVEDLIGQSTLLELLTAGDQRELAANAVIRTRAALNALPALRQRLLQSSTDGSINLERSRVDVGALERQIRSDYSQALRQVQPTDPVAEPIFATVLGPDVITGV